MSHNDEIDLESGPNDVEPADPGWWQRVGLKPLIALPIAMVVLSIVSPNDSLSRMDTAIRNRMSNSGRTPVVGTDDKSTLEDAETQVLGTVLEATSTTLIVDPGLPEPLTIPTTTPGAVDVEIGGAQTVERAQPSTTRKPGQAPAPTSLPRTTTTVTTTTTIPKVTTTTRVNRDPKQDSHLEP